MDIGKIIRLFGWATFAYYALTYAYALVSNTNDPSVSAYTPLIAIEGAFYLAASLVIVWIGHKVEQPVEQPKPPGSATASPTALNEDDK